MVGEEHFVEIAGKKLGNGLSEIGGRPVGEAREHHMIEQARLLGKRRIDLRMRVPMGAGPPGGDEVEDLVTAGVEQRSGFRAGNDDRLALGPMLGERMPDMAPVSCEHVARQHVLGKRGARAGGRFRIVVHAPVRASLARSSSGSMAMSAAGVSRSSQGISAMTST